MKDINHSHRMSICTWIKPFQTENEITFPHYFIVRNVRANDNYLEFYQISPSNAGRYYCTATNPDGNVTKTAEVIVHHNEIPDRTVQGRVQEVFEGETVTLACTAATTPGARVSLCFNN